MSFLCPLVLLVIGAGLGGGLFYASSRMRNRLKIIEEARLCRPGEAVAGLIKLHGTVKAVNPDQLLTSPIDQQPCVYYRLIIEEFRQNHVTSGRTNSSGSWVTIIDDVQAIAMVIADGTGAISIDPKEAELDFQVSRKHANLFSSLPKELEASLIAKYKIVTTGAFLSKQMRYTETVIAEDQDVFALGDCEIQGGKAALVKKEHPLLITFRNEKQVLRNGKIGVTIMKILAIGLSVMFLTLAVLAFASMGSKSTHEKIDPATQELIAKVQSASYSERSRAAAKLAETPVVKNEVTAVAPELNVLLESTNPFYRDSAIAAVKQGWGSNINEPALKRIQETVPDPRVQRDVAAALARISKK